MIGKILNFNGLKFEARADLRDAIIVHPVYDLRNDKVYENVNEAYHAVFLLRVNDLLES